MSTIETISPFPAEELPRVWLWLEHASSSLKTDQGPQSMDEFVDTWLAQEDRILTWGVWRDGELGGWIAYEPITPTTGNAHCVFRKGGKRSGGFWGRDVTRPALEQVAEDLWALGIERIGMLMKEDNQSIIALIRYLGAERECIWERTLDGQVITRNGAPIRMVQYGLYKQTYQDRKAAALGLAGGAVDAGDLSLVRSA